MHTNSEHPDAKVKDRVRRGLPFSLNFHNPVSIGSDPRCDIVVDGADPRHAELRWDNRTQSWDVFDDPAPGATLRNGEAIDSARLYEGDVLDIAGVRIRYADGFLSEHVTDARLRVSLRHVSATAGGKQRLDNISFTAEPGTFVAILGPSGCGKSTLIQRIAGLAPYEGDILFNGHELRSGKARILPLLAYLPQSVEDSLHGEMTVLEAMRDFARTHLAANAAPDFTTRLADVGLDASDIPDKPVHQLSGGQKRRFALALALLRDPQLLLLDEPTAGLDPAAETGIMELLRRIADQGRTVLSATHVLGSLGLCDEVLVLAPGGRRVFAGTPARALVHFGAEGWLDIYRRLQKGGSESDCASHAAVVDAASEPPRELPPPPSRPSFAGPFGASFLRLFRNLTSGWKKLGLFLGLPLGISIVLLLTCWSIFREGNLATIYFCMVIAMFWLGLSGSIRSLVAERVPKRCLDKMRGVPVWRYLPAHLFILGVSASVQSLAFLVPVFTIQAALGEFSLDALVPFWIILALVAFAGGSVGLFVSACCRKELTAVQFLPLIAILALFFSKPVLGEKKEQPLRFLERAMPTFHPQELLSSSMERAKGSDPPAHADNRLHFAFIALGYPLVLLPLAFLFQNSREEEWDGR